MRTMQRYIKATAARTCRHEADQISMEERKVDQSLVGLTNLEGGASLGLGFKGT